MVPDLFELVFFPLCALLFGFPEDQNYAGQVKVGPWVNLEQGVFISELRDGLILLVVL